MLDMVQLGELMRELGQPSYRAAQLYQWLHRHKASGFDEMKNIPASLREKLADRYYITVMDPEEILISQIDGTRKYVFSLQDKNVIEAVLMKYRHGNSVCISSQVGCRMGCRFCASTLEGCVRGLTGAEMLAEVYRIERDCGERISNIVIMGSGEPLDNYDEVVRFIRMISDENGLNISARNITLSTCGIVPGIRRLIGEKLPVTLALSLHASSQSKREEIMPIARKYRLEEVLDACRDYYRASGRRISFEYSVVKGVNDSPSEARRLAQLLNSFSSRTRGGREGAFHVNLIPVNPIEERSYESPDRASIAEFVRILKINGINVTVRREMGRDISSACGQLRRRYIKDADTGIN
ncbi:MAG: 23S rRNA (adenine(2503)-C(2))-methyltransferase RlmN [Clostridiales bacterium]|nr:23S rRNA (adenine(2503)-C(2))-methyltransferase RlmN [Clostridiales bacterium]MDO5140827.1 23S rRNA (adenine(2503)-C(2))-methyltransferase RlmN [Eubacteriales bacterium]